MKNIHVLKQYIYITNDEEIKEGDWCYQVELNDNKVDKCYDITLYHTWTNNGVDKTRKFKKIILTTDQDLIKDGVQAIDDEFLEWFVKNPSCEEVEVEMEKFRRCHIKDDNCNCWDTSDQSMCKLYYADYKTIIPQEEPKQDLEKKLFELEQELDIPSSMRWHNSKPKQETLEEAAEKFVDNWFDNGGKTVEVFEAGAKWQAERSYSYDELRRIAYLAYCLGQLDEPTENQYNGWIRQFKK